MPINIFNRLGQIAGWNEVTVRMLGRDLVGIVNVSYEEVFEDEYLMGAGSSAVGYGKGNKINTASIDLYQEEVNAILSALPPGLKLRDIDAFDMIVTYRYNLNTITDVVRGCRFKGAGKQIAQGDKGIIKSFELNCHDIVENIR